MRNRALLEDDKDKGGSDGQEAICCQKKPKLPNPVETKEELKVSTSPGEKAGPSSVKEKASPSLKRTFQTKASPRFIPQG